MLHGQHLFDLLVAEPVGAGFDPQAKFPGHFQGLPVAAEGVHVQQAGQDFVQRIIGGPHPAGRFQSIQKSFRKGAQVAAAAQGRLAAGQLGHHEGRPFLKPPVAAGGVAQGTSRQVMPHEMPAQLDLRGLPTAQRLCGRRQAGVQAERVQQAVGIEAQ